MKNSKTLLKMLQNKPLDADLYQELGKSYYREKELDMALDAYLKSLGLDDSNPWTYLYLGNVYYHQHNYSEALDMFIKSSELMPDSAVPCWCMADTYEKMCDAYQADKYYRLAVQVDPDNIEANKKLYAWLERQGKVSL